MINVGLKAYVRYDNDGNIVASSLVVVYSKPKTGNWVEVPMYKDSFKKSYSTTKYLRAFIRYDNRMKIVTGSLLLSRTVPKIGNWVEIAAHIPCLMCTTTTTTFLPICEYATILTVGTFDILDIYGYSSDPSFGFIFPDYYDISHFIFVASSSRLQLSISTCYLSLMVYIDGALYIMNSDDGYIWKSEILIANPLPSVGESCDLRICVEGGCTTTTTEEPTTTTSTTTEEITTTTTTTVEILCFDTNYGYLYNWWAATDARNIAPSGWHVPSPVEFVTLMCYIDPTVCSNSEIRSTVAGGLLKETGTSHWFTPNTGATNTYGFNARGSGIRSGASGGYSLITYRIDLQSNQQQDVDFSYVGLDAVFNSANSYFSRPPGGIAEYKKSGLSIRLIKDSSTNTGTVTGNDGKTYSTIKIGNQVWMAENLAETKYRNGELISYHGITFADRYTNAEWAALTTEALCIYNENVTYIGEFVECPTTTTTTGEPEPTTTSTTGEPCDCNSIMLVQCLYSDFCGYIKGYIGQLYPDCESVYQLVYDSAIKRLTCSIISDNCCESLTIEINGDTYELLFIRHQHGMCSYELTGVEFSFTYPTSSIKICNEECIS